MTITVDIPDDLLQALGETPADRERCAREAIAIQLYREGRISLRAMGALAGVGDDYWSANTFRIQHGIPLAAGDVTEDQPALDRLRKQG